MPPMSRDNTHQPSHAISSPPPSRSAKPSASPPPPPPGPPPATGAARTPPPSSTPSRPRNNYSDETTPIASAKRPGGKRRHNGGGAAPAECAPAAKTREEELTPMHAAKPVPRGSHRVGDPARSREEEADSKPVDSESESSVVTEPAEDEAGTSWVGRKVDALFSPVLSFLNGGRDLAVAQGESDADGEGEGEERSVAVSEAIRTALYEASKELDEDPPLPDAPSDDSAYDRVPEMARTDSSRDADGDLLMADGAGREGDGDGGPITANDSNEADSYHQAYQPSAAADESYDDEEEFNPYLFIKSLPPYHYAIPPGWTQRSKSLPPPAPTDPPICLVLDLDETLVHCTVEPIRNADMVFPVEFNGTEYTVHVRCRPFLKEFLERVAGEFEVVVFTASQRVYADKLLDKIDPDGRYIRHRMFRDSCLPVEGNFLKDLTILGRDLRRAVLVDNSPHAFGYQVDNGIPIESWFDDPSDTELLKLERFLRTLHGKEDVREVVREKFQTFRLVLDA